MTPSSISPRHTPLATGYVYATIYVCYYRIKYSGGNEMPLQWIRKHARGNAQELMAVWFSMWGSLVCSTDIKHLGEHTESNTKVAKCIEKPRVELTPDWSSRMGLLDKLRHQLLANTLALILGMDAHILCRPITHSPTPQQMSSVRQSCKFLDMRLETRIALRAVATKLYHLVWCNHQTSEDVDRMTGTTEAIVQENN